MQELLDYIHYLLSYLQFAYGDRNHDIGFVFILITYLLVIAIFGKYWVLYKEVVANNHLSGDEEYRLLKNCFWGRLIFGISFLLLSGRILFLLVPKFYN